MLRPGHLTPRLNSSKFCDKVVKGNDVDSSFTSPEGGNSLRRRNNNLKGLRSLSLFLLRIIHVKKLNFYYEIQCIAIYFPVFISMVVESTGCDGLVAKSRFWD
ncbi:hypothetical protein AVEN_96201-1 [Araneus ventricosus]|uniref:Uncharacterized protein n=1 Tax=Araneus ventricosus TaxID=182803 RepID=A0A4Y2FQS4_ARAVE|nr:hypothetical protein AVEN_96201-1 [Araneus ventricosus]